MSSKRKRVFISAYSCSPGRGSEPGIGWNTVKQMAAHHDAYVLTAADNRTAIEAELAVRPVPGLNVDYFDLPNRSKWWNVKKTGPSRQLHYHVWQMAAANKARQMHDKLGFALSHHITFGRYCSPAVAGRISVPFLWGPIGGGESAPASFYGDFGRSGRAKEHMRSFARWVGEHDPLVRENVDHASMVLATTPETADRLKAMGASKIEVMAAVGLSREDIASLGAIGMPPTDGSAGPIRFISIGRLLHWKGVHLAIKAMAAAKMKLKDAELWIVGDGPEQARLEALAASLGIAAQVKFWGRVTRAETFEKLGQSHVLLHPSLHDSGGWVCLEAMAAGRPVICFELGGPKMMVTPEAGELLPAVDPDQAVTDIATAMQKYADDPARIAAAGEAGKRRVIETFEWESKGCVLARIYDRIAS